MPKLIDWTPERVETLRVVIAEGLSYAETTHRLRELWQLPNLTKTAVRQACARNQIPSLATARSELARKFRPYLDAWRLTGDWMVAADLELPYIDVELADKFLETAKGLKIKQALIAGDIFEFEALGVYAAIVPTANVQDEGKLARAIMESWLEWFEDIRLLAGNHDLRLLKTLGGAVEPEDAMALLCNRLGEDERVHWSVYGYAIIETPTGEWRVTHPRNYRKVPLSVAMELATTRQQHIIAFHEHRTAMAVHPSGKYVIANVGCLACPDKLAYHKLADSTHPQMSQGYAVLKDGQLRLFSPTAGWWQG